MRIPKYLRYWVLVPDFVIEPHQTRHVAVCIWKLFQKWQSPREAFGSARPLPGSLVLRVATRITLYAYSTSDQTRKYLYDPKVNVPPITEINTEFHWNNEVRCRFALSWAGTTVHGVRH